MAPLTAQAVRDIFHPMTIQGRQAETLSVISENVDWKIMGHSPMSRQYKDKQDFTENTLKVLSQRVLTEPLRLRTINVVVSGEESDEDMTGEAVIELEAIDAVCKDGTKYDMRYCWVMEWQKGKIVKVRAYLDTELLSRVMATNP